MHRGLIASGIFVLESECENCRGGVCEVMRGRRLSVSKMGASRTCNMRDEMCDAVSATFVSVLE